MVIYNVVNKTQNFRIRECPPKIFLQKLIDSGKNINDIAKIVNNSAPMVARWLSFFELKTSLQIRGYRQYVIPSKEDLYHKFIVLNKTRKELSLDFNAPEFMIKTWLKNYKIKKDVVQTNKNKCVSNKSRTKTIPKKEQLIEKYIVEKLSLQKVAEIFDVTIPTLRNWLKKYEIKKTRNQIVEDTICTNIEKYGCENPMFVESIFRKSQTNTFKLKPYIFKSGRTEFVRGYEPRCIDYLINIGIDENDLIVGNQVPSFYYIDFFNRKRIYKPDILIKSKQLIIEVKCPRTLSFFKFADEKELAIKKAGLNFEVLVFEPLDKTTDIIDKQMKKYMRSQE